MSQFLKITSIFILICCSIRVLSQDVTCIDSLDKVITTTKNDKTKVDALIELTNCYSNTNAVKIIEISRQAHNLSTSIDYELGILRSCSILSLQYYLTSDLKLAMQYALEARQLAEKLGRKKELALSNDAIGVVYYEIGDKKKSSEYFFESLRIYEALKDKNGIGQTYCRIGTLYLDQNDYDKALEYYSKSVTLAKEINSKEGIASNLNNVAKVYSAKGEFGKALLNYQEAVKINRETGNTKLEGSNYLNISEVYSKKGNFLTALEYIIKAKENFEKVGNQLRIAKCLTSAAEIYLKLGQISKGIADAKTALLLSQQQGFHEVTMDAARILCTAYLTSRDTIKAFRYYQLENFWKDSLSIGEKQRTLTKLELQYQFEKNEQKEQIKQQRRTILIIIIIICLVFSIVVFIFILNSIRLKAKKTHLEKVGLENELAFKRKELTLNVMSLMKKNEILSSISEKLMDVAKDSTSTETKSAIKKIGRELQKGQEDELWKEFTVRFKEVHSDFYNSLLEKFPNLTPNEQKLCAFLRLNMTTKEISELTGQSISTIEIARHRLRQKLNITNTEVNLITFLSQL